MEREGETRLDEWESLRLLAGMSVGRLIYTTGALPAVLPVRFRLDSDGSVLVRIRARSDLARAVNGAVLAFEAGQTDDADGSGWSVTVLGRARIAEEPPAAGAAAGTGLPTEHVVLRLRPELVTGRRLEPAPIPPGGPAPAGGAASR